MWSFVAEFSEERTQGSERTSAWGMLLVSHWVGITAFGDRPIRGQSIEGAVLCETTLFTIWLYDLTLLASIGHVVSKHSDLEVLFSWFSRDSKAGTESFADSRSVARALDNRKPFPKV